MARWPLGVATVPALLAIPRLRARLRPAGSRLRLPRRGRKRRVAWAPSLDGDGRLLLLLQVHGAVVASAPWNGTPEADACVATEPGLVLGIQTADCLPVLLVDPQRGFVAAAHAGWRGTAAGVTRHGRAGARRPRLAPGRPDSRSRSRHRPVLLRGGRRATRGLRRRGRRLLPRGPERKAAPRRACRQRPPAPGRRACSAEAIHHVPDCTHCHPDLYHSYRRDGVGSGRMISFVGFRP